MANCQREDIWSDRECLKKILCEYRADVESAGKQDWLNTKQCGTGMSIG